jgi:hypothetical protein
MVRGIPQRVSPRFTTGRRRVQAGDHRHAFSAARPASVIFTRTTSIVRLPSCLAMTSPLTTKPASIDIEKPCATSAASVTPFGSLARSARARRSSLVTRCPPRSPEGARYGIFPDRGLTIVGSKSKRGRRLGAASLSPNDHFSFVPESGKLPALVSQEHGLDLFLSPPAPRSRPISTINRGHSVSKKRARRHESCRIVAIRAYPGVVESEGIPNG